MKFFIYFLGTLLQTKQSIYKRIIALTEYGNSDGEDGGHGIFFPYH